MKISCALEPDGFRIFSYSYCTVYIKNEKKNVEPWIRRNRHIYLISLYCIFFKIQRKINFVSKQWFCQRREFFFCSAMLDHRLSYLIPRLIKFKAVKIYFYTLSFKTWWHWRERNEYYCAIVAVPCNDYVKLLHNVLQFSTNFNIKYNLLHFGNGNQKQLSYYKIQYGNGMVQRNSVCYPYHAGSRSKFNLRIMD